MVKKTKTQLKHELFVSRLLEYSFDNVKAYKEVYGEKKNDETTRTCAWEIMQKPYVKELIEKYANEVLEGSKLETVKVLERLREIVDVCTQRKKVKKKVKVVKMEENDEGKMEMNYERERVEEYEKYNQQGANKALETIGKYFGMFVEKKEIDLKIKEMPFKDASDEELYKRLEQ